MTVWIERCQHSGRTLTWEVVSSLVKEAHHNGDSNVTQREIDLAHGLRYFQVLINFLITRMFMNSRCINLYMFYIFLQVKHHKAMFCNGHKFCIKKLDDIKKTCDSGISAVFQVTNISSRNDLHPRESKNRYYGILDDILECDFNSFRLVLFVIRWYRL